MNIAIVTGAGFGKFGDLEAIPLENDLGMIDLNCKALGMKLLPHKLVMKIWMNLQKKARNNEGFTL